MFLIIGLGNPDKKYQSTRHNFGQIFLKYYLDTQKLNSPKNPKNIFAFSTTYMNESGIFVSKQLNFYKISPDHLIIIHDDLDLDFGQFKLQFDRSSAGHKGVQSTIDYLHTQAFWRLRLGISKPENPNIPIEDYVLTNFLEAEKSQFSSIFDKITPEFEKILEGL